MNKIGSPGMKNAASPMRKKQNKGKLENKIKSVVEKLSNDNSTASSSNSSQRQVLDKKSVSKIQRTILDIWGQELSMVGPKGDH